MKRILSGITILIAFVTVCWAADHPLVGKWTCTSDDGRIDGQLAWTLVIREEGGKLAGSLTGDTGDFQLIEPKLDGNVFTFKLHINDTCTVETKLKVDGNKFDGTFACPEVSGTLKGTKQTISVRTGSRFPGAESAQASPDSEKIWQDFVAWVKAQQSVDLSGVKYRASLIQSGLTPAQADERLAVIGKLYSERREQLSPIFFDKLYRTPDQTRFTYEPNAFLVQTAKRLKPGKALDIAMGQGRNAVYLAAQGWDVTGYDLADEGMKVANENADKIGVKIKTVHAAFDTFDYGKEQWDLIYFIYTDAPIVDPKFADRIMAALKPGGYLLIERPFLDLDLDHPDPEWNAPLIEQDRPNALFKAYANLRVLNYEDTHEIAEWQQTKTDRLKKQVRIVRILAKKA